MRAIHDKSASTLDRTAEQQFVNGNYLESADLPMIDRSGGRTVDWFVREARSIHLIFLAPRMNAVHCQFGHASRTEGWLTGRQNSNQKFEPGSLTIRSQSPLTQTAAGATETPAVSRSQ
jgi:hypothetical protein